MSDGTSIRESYVDFYQFIAFNSTVLESRRRAPTGSSLPPIRSETPQCLRFIRKVVALEALYGRISIEGTSFIMISQ